LPNPTGEGFRPPLPLFILGRIAKSGAIDMPNGEEPNWKQMIVDIHGDIREIKPKVETLVECSSDHEKRIEDIEKYHATQNGYNIAEAKFYEKHPIKTAIGGSVGIGTIITIVVGVAIGILNYFGVV